MSANCLRRFRAGEVDDDERIRIVSGLTSAIFPSIMEDGGVAADIALDLFRAKSFIARHLWLRVYSMVRWIELGGSETVRPARATNDVVDGHYLLVGSYCDRLLTRETRVSIADRHLRSALAADFDWNIDVNYLSRE